VAGERSVAEVVQDILRNLQEIVRSEVRLAKTEIRADATQAVASGLWVTAGGVVAVSSWMLLLWTAVYALGAVVSLWVATLAVAILTGGIAALLTVVGIRKFKHLHPIPERTIETLKENVEWIKQPTK
jgi:hypothetical protein